MNPNGALTYSWCSPPQPSPPRPHEVVQPTGEVLLHAPQPFKTVTAAVDYIVATNLGAPQPLPAPGDTVQYPGAVDWEHAIIHLMPGVYGPVDGDQTYGNPANGEDLPIHLPPNVSIQGASALNTTFVVGPDDAPAFEFGVNEFFAAGDRTVPINGENTFIDGITITGGVDSINLDPLLLRRELCGIWIAGDVASSPTISNCVIHGMWVGIGIGASAEPGVDHDGVTLANNTFAWNRVGVWNGVDVPASEVPVIGRSAINVLNCIFDATPPGTPPCAPGYSVSTRNGSVGFEGMSAVDMQVLIGGAFVDTNAWETDKRNLGAPIWLGILPATVPRGASPGAPYRDISPYTGALGLGAPVALRGILYVRDLLCRPEFVAPVGTPAFDRSPHDFRLSPNVAFADGAALQAPGPLNPLVDAGWSDGGFSGVGQIEFANGNVLEDPPGFLPLSDVPQSLWAFHSWEYDLEGYGNPRILDHEVYPDPIGPPTYGDPIDIGADELGKLVVAGYRNQTTEFRAADGIINNGRGWYLGPIGVLAAGAFPPSYRVLPSLTASDWPAAYSTTTATVTWHTGENRALAIAVPPGTFPAPPPTWTLADLYPATAADVTPHLLPDIHPWWTTAWSIASPVGIAPALTLWEPCLGANHNFGLYLDPTSGRINPPGAAEATVSSYTWLDGRSFFGATTPPVFLPFGVWGSAHQLITEFDPFCRAFDPSTGRLLFDLPVTSNPNLVPSTLRFSVENVGSGAPGALFSETNNNIQTFQVWVDFAQPGSSTQ